MPDSPQISTIEAWPARACSTASRSDASSSARPTSGCPPWCDALTPMAGPTMDALTGSDLPLAANGGIGVASKMVRDRSSTISVDRIWPASALLMTRAAVLIASPKTR